ncbi:MAG TPA: peptidoglycan-binding protein, partial [Clostridiales bacterium]|nr:peptidoglycan-binding protein [Clostridiales bacterium]
LRRGSRGADVKDLQQKLKSKGYHKYSVDGIFGFRTEQSVKNFQKANGLVADGIVGSATMAKLKLSSTDSSSSRGSSNKSSVEMLHWSTVRSLFPRGATAVVTDVDTGKSFKVYRMGGTNHADVEPLTANDTAIMKSIYGNWSWARRAIIVDYGGRRIAASMNGMPHGQQTIYNNNFNGQFCIHFLGSKTHGSGRVDPDHQAMVRKAAR